MSEQKEVAVLPGCYPGRRAAVGYLWTVHQVRQAAAG